MAYVTTIVSIQNLWKQYAQCKLIIPDLGDNIMIPSFQMFPFFSWRIAFSQSPSIYIFI